MDKKGLIISAVILVLFFSLYLIRSHYDLTLWDEGYNAYIAERVYNGQVPYKEFHPLYAPGRFFIQAFMFKLFGVSLAVERAYTVVVIALFAAVSYLLARQLKINPWLSFWVAILVSHNSSSIFISPSIDRMLTGFIAILGMILYDRTQNKLWLLVTGFLCAVSILMGQETGAYTLLALVVFLCWRTVIPPQPGLKEKGPIWIKDLSLLGAGLFIGAIPFLLYTLAHGTMANTVQDLLIYPISAHNPSPFWERFKYYFNPLALRQMVFFNRFLVSIIMPVGVLFFSVSKMFFYKEKIVREDGYLLMLSLLALFLGIALITSFTPHHLLMNLTPTVIMAMLFFEKAWKSFSTARWSKYKIISLALASYLGLYFLTTTVSVFNSYIGPFRRPCWQLNLPRAKLLIPSYAQDIIGPAQRTFPFKNEKDVKELINHIQAVTFGGEPIFIISQDAMLYFLANRENPTGYDHVNHYFSHIDHQKSMIKDLENKKIKYVIFSNVPYAPNYTCKDEIKNIASHLYNYIINHYQFETRVGFYEFWKRKAE